MKEYHDLFLQSRDKKRDSKLSRIVEEPKIADIKPAAIERPKIPTKPSTPIKHSNIITQQAKTVEKPDIFNIKSVTIEHSKLTFKLLRPIKQPEIIT